MTAFGLGFAGPLQGHYWYTWLDKVSWQLLRHFSTDYCHCRFDVHGADMVYTGLLL